MGRIERDGPVDVGDSWALARALKVPFADLVRRAEEALQLGAPMADLVRRAEETLEIDTEVSDGADSLPAVAQEGDLEDPGEHST